MARLESETFKRRHACFEHLCLARGAQMVAIRFTDAMKCCDIRMNDASIHAKSSGPGAIKGKVRRLHPSTAA